MSAITPTTVVTESIGSSKLLIATFAVANSGATGDTWSTGLNNAVGYWANCTTSGSACSVSYAWSGTTGVFTICPLAIGASQVQLYVMTKG